MVRLPQDHRIAGVKISDIRITPMGATPGVRAKFALVDEQTNPLSLAISHRFSQRTYKIIEALYESMEQDMAAMLAASPAEAERSAPDVLRDWEDDGGDDDDGMNWR
jgi:hypothetical protein